MGARYAPDGGLNMIKSPEAVLEAVDYDATAPFLLSSDTQSGESSKHWHSAVEIIMPVKNGCDISVNEYLSRLEEYDILVIPTGDIHEINASKPGSERLVLQFDFTLFKSVKDLGSASFAFYKPRLITPGSSPELHRAIKTLLLEAFDEYREKRDYFEASITAKLINIAVQTARKQQENVPEAFSEHFTKRKVHIVNFNRCIEYINKHYKEDLSLEFIAGIAGFSKFHFTRWFKQFAGVSFYEYLTQVRIKVAEAMLTGTESPITEIALESGFQSIATFNRVFKSHKKSTPTEFRDRNN